MNIGESVCVRVCVCVCVCVCQGPTFRAQCGLLQKGYCANCKGCPKGTQYELSPEP